MIKTITEYQELAKRTFNDLGNDYDNLLHIKLGVITEIGELLDVIKKHVGYKKPMDIVNIGEEIADTVFYLVNRLTIKGHPFSYSAFETATYKPQNLAGCISLCFDILNVYTQHTITSHKYTLAIPEFTVSALKGIADYFELDFMQILTNNINKLKVRYPDKFDTDKAINRNLDRERIELEK